MNFIQFDIQKYKLEKAPASVYYIPNFITPTEEEQLIAQINSVPKPKWTQLSHRRLQNWGGIPHPKGMIAELIPAWLQTYIDKITDLDVMNGKIPNHVLINEYLPGQGILSHLDGPLFYPTVTTISCGSHAVLKFQTDLESGSKPVCKILVEPRSLLVLQDDMYHKYLHQIDETELDLIGDDNFVNLGECNVKVGESLRRGTRLSLTIRHVPKTSKLKLRLGR